MDEQYEYTIKFSYGEDRLGELKALKKSEIVKEIGKGKVTKLEFKNGNARIEGIAKKILDLAAIMGFFEDYGRNIVIEWIEPGESAYRIPDPKIPTYVKMYDNLKPDSVEKYRYVKFPCCGRYTAPVGHSDGSRPDPDTIEIYGLNGPCKPDFDLADGISFNKYKTYIFIRAHFLTKDDIVRGYPGSKTYEDFDLESAKKAIGAEALELRRPFNGWENQILELWGVVDGPVNLEAVYKTFNDSMIGVDVYWYSPATPDDAKRINISNNLDETGFPAYTEANSGHMSYDRGFCNDKLGTHSGCQYWSRISNCQTFAEISREARKDNLDYPKYSEQWNRITNLK